MPQLVKVEGTLENNVLPRLRKMELSLENIKKVVTEHSEKLQKFA